MSEIALGSQEQALLSPIVDSDPEVKLEVSESFAANNKRLYINNVSFYATEDDIEDLLKEFEVLSVLIPSHTVRGFNKIQQKSLGIAYVDFKTEEDAEKAKVEINGKLLHDRPLRVKNFVPYQPNVSINVSSIAKPSRRHSLFHRRSKPVSPEGDLETGNTTEVITEKSDDIGEVKETVEEVEETNPIGEVIEPIPLSSDTVFISRLSPKITDGDLREYFHGFGATDVYIFKNRLPITKPFFAKYNHVSALVTLTDFETLDTVFASLANKKFRGKRIYLKAAHLTKIEEVKRAAESRLRKLEQQGQEAKGAASAALSAATSELPGTSDLKVNDLPSASDEADSTNHNYQT